MTGGFVITRDTILEHARTLPAAPQVLGGLCELLQDINTDLGQIANDIRVDPALASRVIRLANSVVFGGDLRVGSVDEAVNRVGFAEVLRLVGAATAAGLFDRSLTCYGIAVDRARESFLLHALASEALAEYTSTDPRTAYAGGLLRGLGMMVLDRIARDRLAEGEAYDPSKFETYREWEKARFGLVSMDVTTMVLDEWRFPAEVVAGIEHHLTLEDSDGDRFAAVLHLAGAIVAEEGLALPGEAKFWTVTPEKLEAAQLHESQWQSARTEAHTAFARQRKALY